MFSFHKPKIYRSNNGCCICKAKSSSSRFTDSRKYETEFERCFLIKEIRTGEICNACVLLVKRCKKLPKETNKNWAHVVDARQGNKSNNKAKSQPNSSIVSSPNRTIKPSNDENKKIAERKICAKLNGRNSTIANENESNNVLANADDELAGVVHSNASSTDECDCSNCASNRELDELEKGLNSSANSIRRSKKTLTPKKLCTESASTSSSGNSSDSNDDDEDYMSDDEKVNGNDKMVTRSGTTHSYPSVDQPTRRLPGETISKTSTKSKNKRKFAVKHMQRNESTFLDMNYWKREQVCCGIIFRNKTNDMVLIDSKLFTPCACRRRKLEEQRQDKSNDMKMEIDDESTDKNNNSILLAPSTSRAEIAEKITVNLDDLNASADEQLADSINNPISELVVVNLNSSSGISSSDSSDISSITEEEDSDSSSNHLLSDHNLNLAKNLITNRTFGVL